MAYKERFYKPRASAMDERAARREQEWRDRNAETQSGYLADIAMDGPDGMDDGDCDC